MAQAERAYRPDIDGLRAIAITSVVLYHAGVSLCSGGFSGVDLFFTISGFLIGGHIYSELNSGSFTFPSFYFRRVKRILPALFAVLIAILIASMLLLSPAESSLVGRDSLATALSVSNIVFWRRTGYFAPSAELNPLLMTWSLGVEEQFYMVIPVLMVLLTRLRRDWVGLGLALVSVATFVLAWIRLSSRPIEVFYLLHFRLWELGAGVLLAIFYAHRPVAAIRNNSGISQVVSLVGLALVVAPIALLSRQTPFPGPAALPSVAGAALLIASDGSWINRRILGLAPLVFIGRASYSWYLWHWPLLAFLRILLGRALSVTEGMLAGATAFAAAVLSFYLIERPLRHTTTAPKKLLLRYALAGTVIACICGFVWATGGVPQRFPELGEQDWFSIGDTGGPCMTGGVTLSTNEKCYERAGYTEYVTLWGDSHAAVVGPTLRAIAHRDGYGLREIEKASCPPIPGVLFRHSTVPGFAEACREFNDHVIEMIVRDQQSRIVVLGGNWSGYLLGALPSGPGGSDQPRSQKQALELLSSQLSKTVQSLREAGKRVIILEDVPGFDPAPLWRIRAGWIPLRGRVISLLTGSANLDPGRAGMMRKAPDRQFTEMLRAVAAAQGAATFDLKQSLCDSTWESCQYREGPISLYFDSSHVTMRGAQIALSDFSLPPAKHWSPPR